MLTNIEKLAAQIASDEPLITPKILPQLLTILQKLKDKTLFNNWDHVHESFKIDKTLSSGHLLPITNVSIDKFGNICATGSYDRTCKIWNTRTGEETSTLVGHENAVYIVSLAIAERVLTGSFDKTARIWSLDNGGECLCTMRGHSAEVVAVAVYQPTQTIATSSMDQTTKLFSSVTGQCCCRACKLC
ncbi:PREDICTED: dynein assembly factor with WDR repeat domains 1-like [Diuraphis noxia]|uniref:dynein assembly factor with WDR repeat domains 1-like n=1 Tax=Diuraphis noxia TaxID=143948 RepID=UPI000763992E|nr:PREDICTED: dynein assembly factor with WDR repeat domains 1-like [Diuraphis noxia]